MTTKRAKRLGRGLEVLLGPQVQEVERDSALHLPTHLSLTRLAPGQYQPRTQMDEGALYELAESIRTQGIMQPLLVRAIDDQGRYQALTLPVSTQQQFEIIAGERRFKAAGLAGLDEVPVLIRDVDDKTAAAMALIENMQREDLNPLEEARGIHRLIREFGLTHEEAAQSVGRSRSAASNLLRLLNLTDGVQTMLMAGDLDMGHARALLSLDKSAQITAANQIASKKLSVRETERLVKRLSAEFNLVAIQPRREKSRDTKRVEDELSDLLSAQVEIRIKKQTKRSGKSWQQGELVIQFNSIDELNIFIERIKKTS